MFENGNAIAQFRGPWGVRVEIDQSILLLIGLFIYISLGGNLLEVLIFAAMLVGSIFLHELGHAWGCVVQGVPVRRVVIHGGGGFCEHATSTQPRQEELITAMGPLVNLAIWALCGILSWLVWTFLPAMFGPNIGMAFFAIELLHYVALLGWINLALFAFNLIPVQPLDGGKLFHLLTLRLLSQHLAQRVTGAVGLVFSLIWIPAAIYVYVTFGFLLFFLPSPRAHYRMMRGDLVF